MAGYEYSLFEVHRITFGVIWYITSVNVADGANSEGWYLKINVQQSHHLMFKSIIEANVELNYFLLTSISSCVFIKLAEPAITLWSFIYVECA